MVLRLLLVTAALSLLLTGCTLHAKKPSKPPDASSSVARPVVAKPVTAQPARKSPPPRRLRQPAYAYYPEHPYRLDSGDRLRIAVFGQENLSRDYTVDGSGYISMPLIGAVKARSSTTFELEERIASLLSEKYVRDPKVTVEVQTYRPFFVLGEVREAGQFPYVNGMTVQTAVAIAGGYTERARERSVQLTRRINGVATTRTVPANFPVQPGDTIYVKERFF